MTIRDQIQQYCQYRAILEKALHSEIGRLKLDHTKHQDALNEGQSKLGQLRGEVKQMLKSVSNTGDLSDATLQCLTKKKVEIEAFIKSFPETDLIKDRDDLKKEIDLLSEEQRKLFG